MGIEGVSQMQNGNEGLQIALKLAAESYLAELSDVGRKNITVEEMEEFLSSSESAEDADIKIDTVYEKKITGAIGDRSVGLGIRRKLSGNAQVVEYFKLKGENN